MKLEGTFETLQAPSVVPLARRQSAPPRLQSDSPQGPQRGPEVAARQGSEGVFVQAEKFRQQSTKDNFSLRNMLAISAYEEVSKEQKRAEIQQLLGVDTYI